MSKDGARTRTGIKAVAALAGVGIASVSRVLSGQPGSSPQLTQRVLEAARQLGYTPNALAQGLRRKTTRSIGFVGSDITNPLIASIVSGAEAVLSQAGFSILLTNSAGVASVDAERIETLLQRQVDGLIVLPALEDDPATLAVMRNVGVPLVLIDRTLPEAVPAHYVLSDHYRGVGDACRYLLAAGHRRIALVVGRDVRPTRERVRAVEDAYAAAGLPDGLRVHHGTLTLAHGEAAVEEMLSASQPPTAVILGGNQLLEGALRVVHRRGLTLGVDLSLVCCDDVPLSRFHQPPIATVMRDSTQLGRRAAEVLLAQIASPGESEPVHLETWFEPRGSAGAAPTSAPGPVKGLRSRQARSDAVKATPASAARQRKRQSGT
ncbi:LacI family DNA-binding transcriptional regulator [Chitinasiproducens palmae]|uniref:Transcriptional regulator, LacI family n=1 Tax=Chitinasiproducens palmae TaxID=1770053 RepID=A0A1H2PJM6_9BURK|nr:LacI family DNA-binding transcriptional regulator [Chitinasiproducens palmae]SDV46110.1 transcriptional regulator, LacI family [Chitinasiproducens palmae]